MRPCCDPDLKITNQSICKAFQLRIMHHHTKYGYKMFGTLADIIQASDIYFECSNQFPHKTFQLKMMYHQTNGCKRISSSEDIKGTSKF